MDERQKAEIGKATRYLREHFARPLRAEEVVRQTSYGEEWFRRLFKRATGRRLVDYVNDLRIERARELLSGTDMPVMEVAYECGFRNLPYFTRLFKRATGAPPGRYRRRRSDRAVAPKSIRTAGRVVFRDDFREENECWKPLAGSWRRKKDVLEGSAEEILQVGCTRLLPENFELEMAFRAHRQNAKMRYAVRVELADATFRESSHVVTIGRYGNLVGSLTCPDGDIVWNGTARVAYGTRQHLELRLSSTTLAVSLDREEVLRHRAVFPAPYAGRSNLIVTFWAGRLELSDVEIRDLGIPETLPAIRLGDELYHEGLVSRARTHYRRLLDQAHDPEEATELRYKIAATYLDRDDPEQAEIWARKIDDLPHTRFWADRAKILRIRTAARRDDVDLARERARDLRSERRGLDADATLALFEEAEERSRRGFFGSAQRLYRAAGRTREVPAPWLERCARSEAECARSGGDLEAAGRILRRALREGGRDRGFAIRRDLAFVLAARGKPGEAEKTVRAARRLVVEPWQELVLVYDAAIVQRSRGETRKALEALEEAQKKHPSLGQMAAQAGVFAAQILCAKGKTKEAKRRLEEAARLCPDPKSFRDVDAAGTRYVPTALEGDYAKAHAILRRGYESATWQPWRSALSMLIGGILLELGNRRKEAKAVYRSLRQRYPQRRVNAVAKAAESLECIEDLPYDALFRSELFYWAGRLAEKRKDAKRARRLMRRAVREDPTRRWPAELARSRLRG